ncbi:MAG: hypothetical protein KAR19_02590 [Bacteroidales bacterium]|nr:hypothetical protein [Bacteroidales bacterium]
MKTKSWLFLALFTFLAGTVFVACDENGNNDPDPNEGKFESLESPYLICANRNPGGVGFDFEYREDTGGGNNIDSTTVTDFEEDIVIKTIKGEKPDGSLGGAPYIKLYDNSVEAVNYSSVDPSCTGMTGFNALSSSNIQSYSLQNDDESFDVSTVPTGDTGKPIMADLMTEYGKLAIGIKWKTAANNKVADDEPVWIIKTRDGRLVKLIVSDFPADPAPTSTGFISISWDFVD